MPVQQSPEGCLGRRLAVDCVVGVSRGVAHGDGEAAKVGPHNLQPEAAAAASDPQPLALAGDARLQTVGVRSVRRSRA